MNLLEIIIGAAIVIASALAFIINIFRTPENLRGYYGAMFAVLMVIGFVGGIALISIGSYALIK